MPCLCDRFTLANVSCKAHWVQNCQRVRGKKMFNPPQLIHASSMNFIKIQIPIFGGECGIKSQEGKEEKKVCELFGSRVLQLHQAWIKRRAFARVFVCRTVVAFHPKFLLFLFFFFALFLTHSPTKHHFSSLNSKKKHLQYNVRKRVAKKPISWKADRPMHRKYSTAEVLCKKASEWAKERATRFRDVFFAFLYRKDLSQERCWVTDVTRVA